MNDAMGVGTIEQGEKILSDTELITTDTHNPPQRSPLSDLRANAMSVPVGVMTEALDEFTERRNAFRVWLFGQMRQGVHFGFPPGCSGSTAKEIEYKKRPSLYKAGAEFMVDVLGLRAEFTPLLSTAETIASPAANLCVECKLFSRATGELVGQGIGGRTVGTKKMDFNASLKMAQKSALVMAVLSTYSLSDLFTQDLEDLDTKRESDVPDANPAAKTAQTREDRISSDALKAQLARYKKLSPQADEIELRAAVRIATGCEMDKPLLPSSWDKTRLDAFKIYLDQHLAGSKSNA